MLNCNMMVRSLRCITIEARELPIDAMHMEKLVDHFEISILEQKQ